ncbi:MAG: sensor histidine kinase N-terminal domain-containing protein [Betaproteobacteria bacterium]|nr:sensor histidine kinase N-terminal domain-containing protein [Betaproteobacteria bacterium]
MKSIRRQLLVSLLSTLLLIGLFATLGIYITVEDEFNEIFDYELRQVALSFREDSLGSPIGPPIQIVDEEDDLVIQIWDRAGTLVYVSDALPALPPRAQSGYSLESTPGTQWRVFSIRLREHTIQVAQPVGVRQALAARAAVRTLAPMLFLIAALGIVIWIIVGRGLRPLNRVTDAVEQRSASALQPLPDDNLPGEVKPLVAALNDLLHRLGNALEMQRTFIADAAHELRTPLTAVQLQIQLAERAISEEERAVAFVQLRDGVKRAVHLVQQLLALASHEPELIGRCSTPLDLAQLARQAVADYAAIADAKEIDIGIDGDQLLWTTGDPEALRVMLGNLIDNAIRYTQRGGKIDVSASAEDGEPVLVVKDNGPGIPKDFRARAFDRFSRQEGSGEPGSGLGLAIVRNVVTRHRATIALAAGDHERGLRVTIRFPVQ